MILRNSDVPDDRKVQFRIGVNLGDVIIDQEEIYGDGVNVAARLEALADPGDICISDAVRTAVGRKLDLTYEDMGEQQVKNIEEPVRAYRVVMQGTEEPVAAPVRSPSLELPEEPSIAVLPFSNMSGDPEQEYFSDGITEDIITALSRISGLLVVARNSTMVYKGKAVDIKQVGREQGVRYVLEGSVRKAGHRIRVTAQLINATTGHHQWADRYDREVEDIFAVQDEITQRLTVEMHVQLKHGEQARSWASRATNVEAWEKCMRANELIEAFVREDNLEARQLAQAAIALDPDYVHAWLVLGWTHWADVYGRWAENRKDSLAQAHEAVTKVIEVEEYVPLALGLLGEILLLEDEQDQAVEVLEKAVGLAPNHAYNTAYLADALCYVGRLEEAVDRVIRATRLSPFHPAWYLKILGVCYQLMKEHDLAISTLKEAVQREPESAHFRLWLVSALVEAKQLDDAKTVAREVMRIEPGFSTRIWEELCFKDADLNDRISQNLRRAGLLG